MSTDWTHRSVRPLATEGDPVEIVTERARALTLDMVEAGWPGPPFDPLWVAERLGVEAVPVADAADARTVPAESGRLGVRIEYNPNRPQGRRRFSLAHEIGHLLFEDVAEATRNRLNLDRARSDDWQLELLCNVAASEIVMPVGSLEDLQEAEPRMHTIVDLQRRLDVSFEALLLRIARLTEFPVATFAASRIDPTEPQGFRLDYSAPSRNWKGNLPRRGPIASEGLADCTAVGYTSGADAVHWRGIEGSVPMECVGAPPFPGHRWPRVLGILFGSPKVGPHAQLREVFGDATQPMGQPPWIIAHIVNDRARAWHGGFSAALRRRHPGSQKAFIEHATRQRLRLGMTVITSLGEGLVTATMIAQSGYGPSKTSRLRYQALRDCLRTLGDAALELGASVHMPRIGTGQGRGRWSIISGLVDEELVARGVSVVVYDLPALQPKSIQGELAL